MLKVGNSLSRIGNVWNAKKNLRELQMEPCDLKIQRVGIQGSIFNNIAYKELWISNWLGPEVGHRVMVMEGDCRTFEVDFLEVTWMEDGRTRR